MHLFKYRITLFLINLTKTNTDAIFHLENLILILIKKKN